MAEQYDVPLAAAPGGIGTSDKLVQHLWNEDAGRFYYYDVPAKEFIKNDVIGSYAGLWISDTAVKNKLIAGFKERFAAPFVYPSTSPRDPSFEERRYWRGPVWMQINWILSESLPELIEPSLRLTQKSGLWEYYSCQSGEGLGGNDFAWTAAVVLDWLSRK